MRDFTELRTRRSLLTSPPESDQRTNANPFTPDIARSQPWVSPMVGVGAPTRETTPVKWSVRGGRHKSVPSTLRREATVLTYSQVSLRTPLRR